jgi:peptide methionine sulfoxide reductase msrA/msrB
MKKETAIFAAGCFWGVQYYFDQVPGVLETEAGYIGGHVEKPTYEQVCTHKTGHAEAVKIVYDPAAVIASAGDSNASMMQDADEQQTEPYLNTVREQSQPATQQHAASMGGVIGSADQQALAFRILLKQFFRMHDPTQLNRQGPDVGDNYRSAIFYQDDKQKKQAKEVIDALDKEKVDGKIVTTLEPASTFWPAEEYHQKYTQKTGMGMCHIPYSPV